MTWRRWFWPKTIVTGRSIDELKQAAGSPYPYRLAVGTFWWLGGVIALLSPGNGSMPPVAAPLFLGVFLAGAFFYLRIFRRGLAEVVLLYVLKPRTGFPILGWLWFGNPLREGPVGRVIFAFTISGLAFCFVAASRLY
jgi:hypothetical protein